MLPLLALAVVDFARDVYPVLEKAQCRNCHNEKGPASTTRVRFPAPGANPAAVSEFAKSLEVLVDRPDPAQSTLVRKPTNKEKHTGGQLIQPGSAAEKALIEWARSLPVAALAAPPLRRLTHLQYDNTVRDLLGDQTRPASRFPPEDYVNGFQNQASSQDVPPLLARAYANSAERLARSAFPGGRDVNKLIPCEPRPGTDAACANRFVRTFGARAFRRPLTDAEARRYTTALLSAGAFVEGARVVVEAMLQSPKFLFRIETGGANRPYETASRLSYLLWNTMPDAELFREAASGRIGVDRALRRMLADDRARGALDDFVAQWLRFDLLLNSVKDRRLFPEFSEDLAAAMAEETRRFVADIVWGDRPFMEVFTSPSSHAGASLAQLYGVSRPATEFVRVSHVPESGRAGLLGQAMFLTVTSKPGETSPTIRGFFVREHFLCSPVPDPPPGTNSSLPPQTPGRPLTARQRLGEHVANPACAGCHRLMDPIGFGLEGFDAIGRKRERETITFFPTRETRNDQPRSVHLPLDTAGDVDGMANAAFTDPAGLGRLLAASSQCQECVVKQYFRYAMGRHEGRSDQDLLARAVERFRASQFNFKELMMFVASNAATNFP
ncbi:MAG: DUF1592 domain-containing protein [Acidobacteria bacterium]|nr:DUF1592 domain-containing protein [Acidobacteriota bacterium]